MTSSVTYTLITREDMHTCHKITLWRQVSCPFCKMCCSSSSTLLCHLVGGIGTLRCGLWPTRPCTSTELERYKLPNYYFSIMRLHTGKIILSIRDLAIYPKTYLREILVSASQHPKSIVKIKEAKLQYEGFAIFRQWFNSSCYFYSRLVYEHISPGIKSRESQLYISVQSKIFTPSGHPDVKHIMSPKSWKKTSWCHSLVPRS